MCRVLFPEHQRSCDYLQETPDILPVNYVGGGGESSFSLLYLDIGDSPLTACGTMGSGGARLYRLWKVGKG